MSAEEKHRDSARPDPARRITGPGMGGEEEWSSLRKLTAQGSEQAAAEARHRKTTVFALLLILIIFVLGFYSIQQGYMEFLFAEVRLAAADMGVGSDDAVAMPAEESKPEPEARKTRRRGRENPKGTVAAAGTASQPEPPKAERRPPFNVEVVDRDRSISPPLTNREVTLSMERGKPVTMTPAQPPEGIQISASRPPEVLPADGNVQRSVVLRAAIGRDGSIRVLRLVSGPAELAPAAIEAVKQWRYKPTIRNGQPIESETNITVNFSISTQ